ncbi:MAG: two-component system, NarL family, invasion response regulator UvrY [Solirubrobacteraceae bacterium]|nr:two-component system, NarL family, invasion response regulator UvrY [Solirubrobacteraceae bacterium]
MHHALRHPRDADRRDAVVGVLTVDDDPAFLRLARDVIEAAPGFEVLGEAATGEDGILQVAVLRPQLVLMDVRMPGMGGIEAARRITHVDSRIAVILVSANPFAVAPGIVPPRAIGLVGKERLGPRSLRALWDDWTQERRR